jgi:hypothetical protein
LKPRSVATSRENGAKTAKQSSSHFFQQLHFYNRARCIPRVSRLRWPNLTAVWQLFMLFL